MSNTSIWGTETLGVVVSPSAPYSKIGDRHFVPFISSSKHLKQSTNIPLHSFLIVIL